DAIFEQQQDLFVDTGTSGRGHRVNMLDDNLQEVGVGQVIGTMDGATRSILTVDFGRPSSGGQFVTGIAYNDNDGNAFYSVGEGRGAINVATAAGSAQTGT